MQLCTLRRGAGRGLLLSSPESLRLSCLGVGWGGSVMDPRLLVLWAFVSAAGWAELLPSPVPISSVVLLRGMLLAALKPGNIIVGDYK